MKENYSNIILSFFFYSIFLGKIFYFFIGDFTLVNKSYYFLFLIKEFIILSFVLFLIIKFKIDFKDISHLFFLILLMFLLYIFKHLYFNIDVSLSSLSIIKNFFIPCTLILVFLVLDKNTYLLNNIIKNIIIFSGLIVLIQLIFFEGKPGIITQGYMSNRVIGIFDSPNTLAKFCFIAFLCNFLFDINKKLNIKSYFFYFFIFFQIFSSITMSIIVSLILIAFFLIFYLLFFVRFKVNIRSVVTILLLLIISWICLVTFFPDKYLIMQTRVSLANEFFLSFINSSIELDQPGHHTYELRKDQIANVVQNFKQFHILLILGENVANDQYDVGFVNIIAVHGVIMPLIILIYVSVLFYVTSFKNFSSKNCVENKVFLIENTSTFILFIGFVIANMFTKLSSVVPVNYIIFLYVGIFYNNYLSIKKKNSCY